MDDVDDEENTPDPILAACAEVLPCAHCGEKATPNHYDIDHMNGWDRLIEVRCRGKGCEAGLDFSFPLPRDQKERDARTRRALDRLINQWNRRTNDTATARNYEALLVAVGRVCGAQGVNAEDAALADLAALYESLTGAPTKGGSHVG